MLAAVVATLLSAPLVELNANEIYDDCDELDLDQPELCGQAPKVEVDAGDQSTDTQDTDSGSENANVAAGDIEIRNIGPSKLTIPKQIEPGPSVSGAPVTEGVMSGSYFFRRCQKLATSSLKWSELIKQKQNKPNDSMYTASWKKIFDENAEAVRAAVSEEEKQGYIDYMNAPTSYSCMGDACPTPPKIKSELEEFKGVPEKLASAVKQAIDAGDELFRQIVSCTGLARVVTDQENYQDQDLKKRKRESHKKINGWKNNM